jgi:hypothetical protein
VIRYVFLWIKHDNMCIHNSTSQYFLHVLSLFWTCKKWKSITDVWGKKAKKLLSRCLFLFWTGLTRGHLSVQKGKGIFFCFYIFCTCKKYWLVELCIHILSCFIHKNTYLSYTFPFFACSKKWNITYKCMLQCKF